MSYWDHQSSFVHFKRFHWENTGTFLASWQLNCPILGEMQEKSLNHSLKMNLDISVYDSHLTESYSCGPTMDQKACQVLCGFQDLWECDIRVSQSSYTSARI